MSDNVEYSRFSQQKCYDTREQKIMKLDYKVNEPKSVLFYRGDVHVCTFNDHCGAFSQSQVVLHVDVPTPKQLDNWQDISVLIVPPDTKEFIFCIL